jgi:hypothetical protein
MSSPTANSAPTYILRSALKARLYRDVEIESTASLYSLAEAIVESFEFSFDHAFGFLSKQTGNVYQSPVRYELFADMGTRNGSQSVKETAIRTAFPEIGSKMLFLYDYGDEWRFKVEVIGSGEKAPAAKYPRIVASVGKAPEQYPDPDGDE